MTWSRRAVLGTLAHGAAATILWGCGAGARGPVAPRDPSGLRGLLRDAVARLGGAFAEASALAAIRSHTVATADAGGRAVRTELVTSLVLAARDAAGRRFERVAGELTADGIAAAVDALLDGRRPGRWRGALAAPVDAPGGAAAEVAADAWGARAGELYAHAEAAGSSRVVYRAGYVEVDDASVWFVGGPAGRDAFQRLVRGRAGTLFVAWSGGRPSACGTEAAGAGGLELASAVRADAVAAAAAHALEPMTPGAAPDGDGAVVMDPSVVAAVVDAGVADVMTAEAWRRVDLGARGAWRAADAVTIADDPAAAAYGGYAFADDGAAAARALLVDRGAPAAPLTAVRRAGFVGPARAGAGHVVVAPGERSVDDLLAAAGRGLLVEDAGAARVDPARWEIVVPIGRGRRFDGGRRTGHVYADLELRARVPELLAAVTGASREVGAVARRELDGGEPRWRSASAPHLASRAHVGPRARRS